MVAFTVLPHLALLLAFKPWVGNYTIKKL